MKKVLYIGGFEFPDKNAAAQRVVANGMTLRELGYEVDFISPTKDRTNIVKEYNGFKCEYIDYPSNLIQWIKYITIFVSVDKIFEYNPNYVVLYNFPAIASLRILRACHKQNIKVIHDLTEWESSNGWSPREIIRKIDINLRMHYCIKKMDGVIAISRYLYDYYSKHTKVVLVPPTVDLDNIKFNRTRQLSVNRPLQLVFAGTCGNGVKDRIDSIVNSVSRNKSLMLTLVGITYEDYKTVYGPICGGAENIVFKGRVSHKEAVSIVCNSDYQLLIRDNSLKNRAGFPTKYVESMSCCTPVIATMSSNICDYLIDGVNGFIVNDTNHLDDVLDRILQMNHQDIIKMKVKCRECNSFDYRNYFNEFSIIFD